MPPPRASASADEDEDALRKLVLALHFLDEQRDKLLEVEGQAKVYGLTPELRDLLNAAWNELEDGEKLATAATATSPRKRKQAGLTGHQLRAKTEWWRVVNDEAENGIPMRVAEHEERIMTEESEAIRWDAANSILDSLTDVNPIFGGVKEFKELLHGLWKRSRMVRRVVEGAKASVGRVRGWFFGRVDD